MSQPILVVIIVLALVAAAALIIRSHKGVLKSVGADLKAHVSQVSAGAEARLVRLIARVPAEPSKVAAPATPAKPIPIVGTTAEPAPAAPAASVTAATPPATVAPAAPPAAPAPSAGGGGTASSQLASSYPGKHDLLVAAAAIKTPYAIAVDGMQVWPGFGPPDEYFSRPDGSVSKVRAPAVMMPAGSLDAMAASYPNVAALLSAIAAAHFTGAVEVDGKVVHAGFGKPDGSPWAYITQPDGTIKAA